MKQDKKQLIVETLINKMFEIAEHNVTYNDIKDRKDNWYHQWTMTESQRDEWMKWGVDFLKKKHRMFKKLADREMAFFDLMYGLKTIENENK